MEAVFDWVSTYGYAGIFFALILGIVGLPVPDETLMVFCGYLISTGRLHPVGAFLSALAGSWCGITTSYLIGRTFGASVTHRFGKYVGITDARLENVHGWFNRTGHWALFIGYYIAGVRHFTAIVAGTSKLEFRTFALYAWSGGLIWVITFLTLGYFLGEKWRSIFDVIHRYGVYISIVVVLAALAFYFYRSRRSR